MLIDNIDQRRLICGSAPPLLPVISSSALASPQLRWSRKYCEGSTPSHRLRVRPSKDPSTTKDLEGCRLWVAGEASCVSSNQQAVWAESRPPSPAEPSSATRGSFFLCLSGKSWAQTVVCFFLSPLHSVFFLSHSQFFQTTASCCFF